MISYSPEKNSYIYDRGYCHKKINEFGQKSQLNKSCVLEAKHSQTLSFPRIKSFRFNKAQKMEQLSNKCKTISADDISRKIYNNPQATSLQFEKISKNQKLLVKISQLKELHVFDRNRFKNIRYQNQNRQGKVMNDFHSPKTNGGFSRSKTGGIYYK